MGFLDFLDCLFCNSIIYIVILDFQTMGHVKLPLKLINGEKSRKLTALKRTKGLKKKATQLSTLCGLDVSVICFGSEGDQPEISPENMPSFLSIIERYRKIPKEIREKNELKFSDFMETKVRKQEQELEKKGKMEVPFHTWEDQLNDYSEEGLRNLATLLDSKLGMVEERLRMMRQRVAVVSSEEKEESAVKVDEESIQGLPDYLLATVESRSHIPMEYMPLPVTSCIDFSSIPFNCQYPCNPNNCLQFSNMGFPAGLPDYGEINNSLIQEPFYSIGSSSRIGVLENTGFFTEQYMDNLFQNEMIISSQNAGIRSLENMGFSGEQGMNTMFENKMDSYNSFNVGYCHEGVFWPSLNQPSTSIPCYSSFGSCEFQGGLVLEHVDGEKNWELMEFGNQYFPGF